MRRGIVVCGLLATLSYPAAAAAEEAAGKETNGFHIEPTVLDSDDGDGATLGLQYDFKKSFELKSFAVSDEGETPDASPSRGALTAELDGSGTFTVDAERNPKNFLDATLSVNLDYDPGYEAGFGRLIVGGFVKGETDQSFENQQIVLGAKASYGRRGLFGSNDFFALDVRYGRVEPGEDKARQQALGVTDLDDYNRFDAEALYMWRTGWNAVPVIEFNYRLFYEPNAPTAIQTADLERFQLSSVRASLGGDLFVAYSQGKLPFDKEDDRILEIGVSYKIF